MVINQEGIEGEKAAVDLYFEDMGTILEDLPKIAKLAEVPPEAVSCHHSLLACISFGTRRILLPD